MPAKKQPSVITKTGGVMFTSVVAPVLVSVLVTIIKGGGSDSSSQFTHPIVPSAPVRAIESPAHLEPPAITPDVESVQLPEPKREIIATNHRR